MYSDLLMIVFLTTGLFSFLGFLENLHKNKETDIYKILVLVSFIAVFVMFNYRLREF